MKSIAGDWVTVTSTWYNDIAGRVDALYNAAAEAMLAVQVVENQGDIGSLTVPVTDGELEEHNENRRRIVTFCTSIHYEIEELVDNPFSVTTTGILQNLYDLDPKDINVRTGQFLFISVSTTLADLLISTFANHALRQQFLNECTELDDDAPNVNLLDSMKEALFWENEFKMSHEIERIAQEVFPDEVRKKWSTMTQAAREQLATEYALRIGERMKEGRTWWDKLFGSNSSVVTEVKFDAGGFGVSYSGTGTISINPDFVANPAGSYSIDKMIETLTHETRHAYQHDATANPEAYGIPDSLLAQWSAPYISASDPTWGYAGYFDQEVERDARGFAGVSRP
jgi:hypothetical protein